ncbi:MAG: hypothetical protein MSS42_00165 [Bacteroidales bacterium]|nr:hypothetical protein [Bacteroidales bacterium]
MMRKSLSLILVFLLSTVSYAKTNISSLDYEIAGVAIAIEGNYLVEVSAMVDKKKDATIEIAKQCAIHGCLFKGFVVDRIFQKPIMSLPSIEKEHQVFFEKLIREQYQNYTNSTYPIQIVKVGKRYRVKAIILVAKDALRKTMEKEGIISKLGL